MNACYVPGTVLCALQVLLPFSFSLKPNDTGNIRLPVDVGGKEGTKAQSERYLAHSTHDPTSKGEAELGLKLR